MKRDKRNNPEEQAFRRSIKAVEYPDAEKPQNTFREPADTMGDSSPENGKVKPVPKAGKVHKNRQAKRQAPSRPKAKSKFGRIWSRFIWPVLRPAVSILIGLLIVVGVGVMAFKYAYTNYFSPVDAASTEEIDVVINTNDSLATIANKLEEAGIIRNSKIFKYYVDFSDMSSKLLAGKFTLSPSMTFDDIISILKRSSAAAETTRLTFAEGISVETYAALFTQEGVLENDLSFMDKVTTGLDYTKYWFIQEVLAKEATTEKSRKYVLEGYLFPETYDFYISSTADQAIEKLLDQFEKVFTDEYRERAEELGMSVDDVVILASMIEKEAKEDDFAKVSAVFHNRLEIEQPLQSCATHRYFMEEKKLVYSGDELKIDSPYNTYLYGGLPIGPICNPGKAAIEAALWPEESYLGVYYYFCLGDPATGETIFSKTYEEHLAAQAKYSALWDAYED